MFSALARSDWALTGSLLFLALASLVTIASASSDPSLLWQQGAWFSLALVAVVLLTYVDVQPLFRYRWVVVGFYLVSLVSLVAVLLFAPVIRESRSWLPIGPLRFQPAELAKVALILLFALFFARRHAGIAHLRTIFVSFLYVALPAVLVLLQPDWGSALVLLSLWVGVLLVSGLRLRHIAIGAALVAATGIASWYLALAPYQKDRIIGFLEPGYDPLGVNYSAIQAKVAIGSAGLFGAGFREGTQTQLGFLTEPATDFAFAAFIEEWGLIAGVMLVAAFLLAVVRILAIGRRSESTFTQFVCLTTAILFLVEFSLNVGSNIGLSPVVGVTFPFFSYGGSSILTKGILIGIIQGAAARMH
ncbi:MAG: rod shape-determining protein RodA [Candidatus Colwellbacteria bacterium]|nr:rod shape-determining protein RodA [Candidatus Colwellbacteria bacterium]